MKKGMFTLKGAMTALFVAAFFMLLGSSFGAVKAEAAVSIKYKPSVDATKYTNYVADNIVNLKTLEYNRDMIQIRLIDTTDVKLKSISCGVRYKLTYKEIDSERDDYTYRYSFYSKKNNKNATFSFVVDGKTYTVKLFASKYQPVKKATFGKETLSTDSGKLGNTNYITNLSKGRFKVEMNTGYLLTSIQVGRFKNSDDATVTWKEVKNNKVINLSSVCPETDDESNSSRKITTYSMVSPTILRINYKIKSTGSVGYIDYVLNRYVDADN